LDWNWQNQKRNIFTLLSDLLNLPLNEIWISTIHMETIVSILTKSFYLMLENQDNLKDTTLRNSLFDVLAFCVVKYNHGFSKF
jgi:hypothetical protein